MTAALKHNPLPGPMPKSNEWNAIRLHDPNRERPVVFGASEAAAVCGVSPYSSPLQLYLEKRREIPTRNFTEEQEDRIDCGIELEPAILSIYAKRQDCSVQTGLPMYFHPGHSFMAATPDAMAGKHTEGVFTQWTVDSKDSGFRMYDRTGTDEHKYGSEGTDEVPLIALYQAQQLMEVMGTDRCDFPVLFGRRMKIYSVPRNDDLISTIRDAEQELAERIQNGEPPEPTYRHAGTRRLLNEMYGCSVGTSVELPPEVKDLWLQQEELQLQLKDLQQQLDERTNMILAAFGEAQVATFPESDIQLKRIIVKDSIVTQKDVDSLQSRVGLVGRKGHVRLQRVRAN